MKADSSAQGLRTRNRLGLALLTVGMMAMIGDLIGSFAIKGLGAITCVAPFPKVFCEMDGVEGFAGEFEMIIQRRSGEIETHPIDPALYSRMEGPYNRRNVFGAALAGGPFLPEKLWQPVYRYGLAPGGPIHEEFGLPADTESVRIHIRSKTRDQNQTWTFAPTWTE